MSTNKIISLQDKLAEIQEKRREDVQRLSFEGYLESFIELSEDKIFPIKFLNISYAGGLFEFFYRQKDILPFELNSKVKIRFYITSKSFISAEFTLIHSNFHKNFFTGKTFLRYGGSFNQETQDYPVLLNFIKFIYTFSEKAKDSKSERIVSAL